MTPPPPDRVDAQFGRIAMQQGLVTAELLEDAQRFQRELAATGESQRLGEVMVRLGILTHEQVERVLHAQGKVILACPSCQARYNVTGMRPGMVARCKGCGTALIDPPPPRGPRVRDSVAAIKAVDPDAPPATRNDADPSTAAVVQPTAGSPQEAQLPALPAGDLLARGRLGDRFVLERELGRGGMGIVYLARDEKLGRPVALKVLRTEETSPELLKRFFREAEATKKLRHPGIVRLLGVGEYAGRHFLAMEYVDGMTLHHALKEPKAAGLRRTARGLESHAAAQVMLQVAEAVEHAHEFGVLHRDLKPGNVLIDRAGVVKVVDFGLAKDVARSDAEARLTGA